MGKASISRTHGPIHFEDLDPHRFEDLVRELAYDFRDWVTIEATGRSGNDEGFDIRAFERVSAGPGAVLTDENDEETFHPMEGRVWKFQCKREKAIGPKKLAGILSDGVNPDQPPYAYVLAAPANFSKAAYDVFRRELRERGVLEFYLWGRAELEDMLHLPKNDHVLFTFFGISLLSRRRSRATELRSFISIKNRLQKLLGKEPSNVPILLRDTKDVHYPYSEHYSDFDERPRWREQSVIEIHSLGLVCEFAKYFAICDLDKGIWDYTAAINTVRDHGPDDSSFDQGLHWRVGEFAERFRRSHQATLIELRFVRFDSVVAIDGEGDTLFDFPHVYVDFHLEDGPFSRTRRYLSIGGHEEDLEGLKRVELFPAEFPLPSMGKINRERTIELDPEVRTSFRNYRMSEYSLYDCDGRRSFLDIGDVIEVAGVDDRSGEPFLIKITSRWSESARKLMSSKQESSMLISRIQEQIGRKLEAKDTVNVYEFKRVYKWELQDAD